MTESIQPAGWPQPRGYSNGTIAHGRFLAVAGQVGWNERGELVSDDFVEQAERALRNVVAVVAAGLLAGCQVGPAFRAPHPPVPPRFDAAAPANAPPA